MTAGGKGILVAGMHRSGTSALSGALQRLGVVLGDRLIPAAEDNPKGYFEHERVVAIHDELFRALGSWWYDPRPLPTGWLESPAARRAGDALAEVLRADFADEALWAVKDPRLCRFLPLWRRVLDRLAMPAGALLVLRAPVEVAASLTARNGFGPELGHLLWLRHVLDAVRDTEGMTRTAVLYDDLMADAAGAIDQALGRLGIERAEGQGPQSLAGFIEKTFRHHTADGDGLDTPLAALSARVFDSFRDIVAGKAAWAGFEAHQRDFAAYWGEVGPAVRAMADAVFPEIEANARLSSEVHAVRAELNAQLRWGEEVLGQHRDLSAQQEATRASLAAERDALQAALAHARGELLAQVRWAETSLQHDQEQQVALAQARSDLAAQVQWAEAMLSQRDELKASLIAQRDELQLALSLARSDLAAQVRWGEAMIAQRDELGATLVAERDELRVSLALARSDLAAQVRWADAMIAQRDELRESLVAQRDELRASLELSRADFTTQARAAEQAMAQHQAALAEAHAQAARDRALIEQLRALERELAEVKASASWRWTRPLRALAPGRKSSARERQEENKTDSEGSTQ